MLHTIKFCCFLFSNLTIIFTGKYIAKVPNNKNLEDLNHRLKVNGDFQKREKKQFALGVTSNEAFYLVRQLPLEVMSAIPPLPQSSSFGRELGLFH